MALSNEAKRARREYLAAWRKKNPDKVNQYRETFWEKKARNVPIEVKVMNLHNDGFSLRQIESELGVSKSSAQRIISRGTLS